MGSQIGQPSLSARFALAADLKVLTAALDDPDADLDDLLRGLTDDVRLAVPSYLGLTMSLVIAGDVIGWTVMDDHDQSSGVGASALLPLPSLCDVEADSVIIFYAEAPGAFVDFAADVCYALGLDLGMVVVDQHLSAPTGATGVSGLSDMSLVNQAVGILIDRVGSVGAARTELYRLAHLAQHTVLLTAKQLIRSTALRARPSRDVLGALIAAAPDVLLAVDVDGRILYVDDQAELMFGWPSIDLVGQPIERLIPASLWDHHIRLRDTFVANPVTRPMGVGLDLSAVRRDGSQFRVDVSLRSFRSADAAVIGVAIRDLSPATRSEHSVPQLGSVTADAMLGIDAANRIALLDGLAEELFGWTSEELLDTPAERVIAEPFPATNGQVSESAGGRWFTDNQVNAEAIRKDGSVFTATFTTRAVIGPGSVVGLVTVHATNHEPEPTDVPYSPLPQVQTERLQRMELLGELAGGVAHDFNNLLGVIQNYTVLLRRQVTDPRARADLDEIRVATERAAVLTRQLLMFSHSADVVHEALELNQVIRRAASMLERTLGAHIQLQLDLADGPLLALADAQQLEQIVLNLAINARDAMPAGGRVTIRTSRQATPGDRTEDNEPGLLVTSEGVILQVVDEGLGMTADVMNRAFEPFFTTKLRGDGTGLGLASVKSIVTRSGGTVSIDSTVGHGTTITIVLQPARHSGPVATKGSDVPAGGHEKILLVEDEPSLRVATERILTERGYEVVTASNGVDALDIFDRAKGSIQLVLSDVAMPRMRGDELARILFHRRTGVPVILMTGYDFGDAPDSARHLSKPVAEETLLRAIRSELDAP